MIHSRSRASLLGFLWCSGCLLGFLWCSASLLGSFGSRFSLRSFSLGCLSLSLLCSLSLRDFCGNLFLYLLRSIRTLLANLFVFGSASFSLFKQVFRSGFFGFGFENEFHKDTFIFEGVTLGFQI
eukprot:Pompholyxophrys_punicea_v1_NODE_1658_length_602_cov_27.601463.p2 type:complete len:125 gc:universal NODE_1658_length_602_cov_27.601463:50-424(+)